ncbi:MAG TPA: hypothetical protein DCL77_01230 [Prolixibacteraceae bacterium]|jgi:hypothetical protein|nr:hypothetical protein [Prolixibacteraceae bacterium]
MSIRWVSDDGFSYPFPSGTITIEGIFTQNFQIANKCCSFDIAMNHKSKLIKKNLIFVIPDDDNVLFLTTSI